MVRFDPERTQAYADAFVDQLRANNVPIGYVDVRDTQLPYGAYMATTPGVLYIDSSNNYPGVDEQGLYERVILHELGHQATWEEFPELRYRSGNDVVDLVENEGLAEYFSLDLFPDLCDVSSNGWNEIQRARRQHLTGRSRRDEYQVGYRLFHDYGQQEGFSGITDLLDDGNVGPLIKQYIEPEKA